MAEPSAKPRKQAANNKNQGKGKSNGVGSKSGSQLDKRQQAGLKEVRAVVTKDQATDDQILTLLGEHDAKTVIRKIYEDGADGGWETKASRGSKKKHSEERDSKSAQPAAGRKEGGGKAPRENKPREAANAPRGKASNQDGKNGNKKAAATTAPAPGGGGGKSWASLARGAEPAPAPVVEAPLPSPHMEAPDMGGWGAAASDAPDMFHQMMKMAQEGATSGQVTAPDVGGWGAKTATPMDLPEVSIVKEAPPPPEPVQPQGPPAEVFESSIKSTTPAYFPGAETVLHRNHMNDFILGIQHLWDNRQLCDLKLLTNDPTNPRNIGISVHSAVLAAVSPAIRDILLQCTGNGGGMPPELVVHIEPNALQEIIRFMYTGELRIHDDSVADLMQAADTLALTSVADLCVQFLGRNITAANALNTADIAARFKRPELKAGVDAFLLQNIANSVLEDDFLQQPMDRVMELLSSDQANFHSEVDVFRAVVRWVKYDLPQRSQNFAKLMADTVRLPLMTSEELLDEVEGEELVRSDRTAQNLVFDTYRYQSLPENRRATMDIKGTQPRQTNRAHSNYF